MNQEIRRREDNRYLIALIGYVCAFLIVVFSLTQFYKELEKRELRSCQQELQDVSVQGMYTVKSYLDGNMKFLEGIAGMLHKEFGYDREGILRILRDTCEIGNYEIVGIAGLNGLSLDSRNQRIDVSQRSYYQRAIQGETCISEVIDSAFTESKVFVVATPIHSEKRIVGVLYGVYDLQGFSDLVKTTSANDYQYMHVIDKNGNFILNSTNKNSLFNGDNMWKIFEDAAIEDVLSERAVVDEGYDLEKIKTDIQEDRPGFIGYSKNGNDRFAYYMPLGINDWFIMSIVPQEVIFDNLRMQEKMVMLQMVNIGAAMILVILVIAYMNEKSKEDIRQFTRELQINEELIRIAMEQTENMVFEYDSRTKIMTFKNKGWRDYGFGDVVENVPESLIESGWICEQSQEELLELFQKLSDGEVYAQAVVNTETISGEKIWEKITLTNVFTTSGKESRIVGVITDVSEERRLKYKAEVDALTGLYNRGSFRNYLKSFLDCQDSKRGLHAVLVIDVDNFKRLNDQLGHAMGDQGLKDIAVKLQQRLRKSDLLGRLGGDEFGVLLRNVHTRKNLEDILEELSALLMAGYLDGEKHVEISVSIGAVIIPEQGAKRDDLYRKADRALYSVKNTVKNGYAIYDESMEDT